MLSSLERTEVSIWDRKYTKKPKIMMFFLKEDHETEQDQGPQQRSYEEQNMRMEWNAWWPQKSCNNTRKKSEYALHTHCSNTYNTINWSLTNRLNLALNR